MPIIRGRHAFEGHFTQIPNKWLRDKRLSYKARGLLAELLSHEPGFRVSRDSLARNGQDGDRAVRTAIGELEAAGYLKRSQSRSDGLQKFGPAVWITCDPFEPSVQNEPTATSQSVHYPPAGYPPADNAGAKKTILEKTKETEERPLVQGKLEPVTSRFFEEFWAAYPRRQGRGAAIKAFEKAAKTVGDVAVIMAGARQFAADPYLPPKQFIPMPATWLNQERWADGPLPERTRTPEEKAAYELEQRELRRSREAAQREASRLEREAEAARIEKELAENPVPICEHGRIVHVCRICTKI